MNNEDINSCCMGYNSFRINNYILVYVVFIDGYLFHIYETSNEDFRNVIPYFYVLYKKY